MGPVRTPGPRTGPTRSRQHARDIRLTRAALPHMRYHDLRHSCASFMAAQGVPAVTAKEILGHSDIRLTLNVYTHVLDEAKRKAAETMDRLFGS